MLKSNEKGIGLIEIVMSIALMGGALMVSIDSLLQQSGIGQINHEKWRAQMLASSLSGAITSLDEWELVDFLQNQYLPALGNTFRVPGNLADTYIASNTAQANLNWFNQWENHHFVNRVYLNLQLKRPDGTRPINLTGIDAVNIKRDYNLIVTIIVDYQERIINASEFRTVQYDWVEMTEVQVI